ncbi:Flp pilus assembly protein CpaB [Pseudomonas mandelii]|uniref:Flp pilus assembly protein CpaB n=1 Tax=Pseudomonas mandelii TaxID=75612 RepID=UPI000B9672ED|nr:Flp pilus assembly protein CpaB [Pseudomonas mandelii]OYQ19035.1 Flp pilus assembly protein CpaB [Pseudomonas mandelii]
MNSRVTMGLAGFFLVGAIIAGYWGLTLSRQPAPDPVTPPNAVATAPVPEPAPVDDPTRQPVVVLLRDVAPFVQITAADVTLEKLRTAPAGSLTRLDQAIGRTPWRALTAGTWLNAESFEAGSALSRMIRPDERALAVAVDEVINAGGQLSPGDYVDVMLFLRADANNVQPSAQVVVPAMRLLSVGDQMGLTNDGAPATPPALTAEEKAQRHAPSRTVVLAVPEQLLSRLMLATQAGTLRLAVRSADERLLSHYWAGESDAPGNLQSANRDLYQFTQLAFAQAPKKLAQGSPRRTGVEVIRGNQATQQTP